MDLIGSDRPIFRVVSIYRIRPRTYEGGSEHTLPLKVPVTPAA